MKEVIWYLMNTLKTLVASSAGSSLTSHQFSFLFSFAVVYFHIQIHSNSINAFSWFQRFALIGAIYFSLPCHFLHGKTLSHRCKVRSMSWQWACCSRCSASQGSFCLSIQAVQHAVMVQHKASTKPQAHRTRYAGLIILIDSFFFFSW